jgi:hydrogenase/urease accessory protein HupE
MRIKLNLEAILAGIDPKLTDTSESPNAFEYNRLRALPPDQLQAVFDDFKEEFVSGLRFDIDGKPVPVTLKSEEFNEVGDLSIARVTRLEFDGALVSESKVFTFGWAKRFGTITLRTVGFRARSSHIQVLENGAASAPLVIDDIKTRTIWDMIGDFIVVGFEHIVPKGLDHILFVTGIFLLSIKIRPILVQVTSFTVAHTVTLGLGTLGVINLPSFIVEPLIAASIVYVAVENILRPTLSPWRPIVVFLFGLLHGLGFAGILREIGIPEGDFLIGLLSFNLGVELGQLTVIGACFLLVGIWFGNKPWYRQRIVIPCSLAIAAIGAFWFLQRAAF